MKRIRCVNIVALLCISLTLAYLSHRVLEQSAIGELTSGSQLVDLASTDVMSPHRQGLHDRHEDEEPAASSWWRGGGVEDRNSDEERHLQDVYLERLADNGGDDDTKKIALERQNADCIYELPLVHRVACIQLRRRYPILYNRSWCPHIDVCVVWGRGTISSYGQERTYRRAYRGDAQPLRCEDKSMEHLLLYSSLTDLRNEMSWLTQRLDCIRRESEAQEKLMMQPSLTALPPPPPPPPPLDVTPFFQGRKLTLAVDSQRWLTIGVASDSSKGVGPSHVCPFHIADPRRTASRFGFQPNPDQQHKPSLVVFHGDSATREVFFRVVHRIRHDDREGRPFFDIPTWGDVLYVLWPSHDELRFFDSPSSRKKPRRLVTAAIEELLFPAVPQPTNSPLIIFVFFFAKRTRDPRNEVWGGTGQHPSQYTAVLPLVFNRAVTLLVEGTLYWERERSDAFVERWSQLATVRTSSDEGAPSYPFVSMTGHLLFEPCRHGMCKRIAQRVVGRSGCSSLNEKESVCAKPHVDYDYLHNYVSAEMNASALPFNSQKLVKHLLWAEAQFKARDATQKEVGVWSSIHVLDKAKLPMIPNSIGNDHLGLLPVDHIHHGCRVLDASVAKDALMQRAVHSRDIWRSILTAGGRDMKAVETESMELDALVPRKDLFDLPPPKSKHTAWDAATRKAKDKPFRWVVALIDDRGCLDIGNGVLVELLSRVISVPSRR